MRSTGFLVRGALVALALHLAPAPLAGSPSLTGDMPPEILSWRREILSRADYGELARQWREYVKEHPRSAVARVQLARALRYEGRAPIEERHELLRQAWKLDPECPEALEAATTTTLGGPDPLIESIEEAIRVGERAVEIAPDWPEPHFGLWTHCVLLDRDDEAEEHLRAIVRKGAYRAPLLDFAHNLLVSADPGAIIFTNGDNDTYPLLGLQALHGLRRDVAIVNLSLLNREEYALSIWKKNFGDDAPFTERELRNLVRPRKRNSPRLVSALVERVKSGTWKQPVYFALTAASSHLECCEGALRIEGLLWRVLPESLDSVRPEKADEPDIDAAKTLRLFREEFRLESATDLAQPWGPVDATTQILSNYPAVLRILATDSARKGAVEDLRFAMRKALTMLQFHGKHELLKTFAEYWKELEPENPEVNRWL